MMVNYNAIQADRDAVVWGTRRHEQVYHSLDVTASPGGAGGYFYVDWILNEWMVLER
jgi:hypothetical protein